MTAVFVENANTMYVRDEDEMSMSALQNKMVWIGEASRLFQEADIDDSGFLNLSKFENHLQDVRVQALLRKLGVEVFTASKARDLFALLDFDQSGSIDVDEFTLGLEQIHGEARGIDIAKCRKDVMNLNRKIDELAQCLMTRTSSKSQGGSPWKWHSGSTSRKQSDTIAQRDNGGSDVE